MSADKLYTRTIPCVFLGFPPNAPGWQFYHPTSRRVLPSQDVMFDESVPFYCLFPYRYAPLPPPPLFCAPGPPLVDPLPPQGPAPSGVSQVDPLPGTLPVEVAVDSCAARGAVSGGDEPAHVEPWGADPASAEPGGAVSKGAWSGGAEPWAVGTGGSAARGPGGGVAGAASLGGVGVPAGAGGLGGAGAGDLGASGTGAVDPGAQGTEAAGAGGVGGAGAGGAGAGGAGAGGTGAGGASAGGAGAGRAGAGDPGAGGAGAADLGAGGAGTGGAASGGTGAGGTMQRRPFFVPPPPSSLPQPDSILREVLSLPSSIGLPPSLLSPPPLQSQPQLQPDSPLPAPSPYAEWIDSFIERREPESPPSLPVRTGRRVPRPRPPPVPGTHAMALLPSSVPMRVPLPPPLESSLPAIPYPESDLARAASPTVPRLLATVISDPSFESTAASALVAELVDFVESESESNYPLSIGGECALGTDVLEDRHEDFECLAAAVPHLVAMVLAPEGDPDAPDIPTPHSYAKAITVMYVDNKAMIALCQESRLEHRTKHIALHYFLARELQQRGQLRLAYVATRANTADIFTKALQFGDHPRFCTVLGLVPTLPHLLTA
ncbi:unnamed protein product [Closterium sp. NIES-53]